MSTTNIDEWLNNQKLSDWRDVVDIIRAIDDEDYEGIYEGRNNNGIISLHRDGDESLALSSEKAINYFVSLVRKNAGIKDTEIFEDWVNIQRQLDIEKSKLWM